MEHSALWNKVLDDLETRLETDTFNELFKNCYAYSLKNNYLNVVAPSLFVQTRINKLYLTQLNTIILKYTNGELYKIKIILESDINEGKEKKVSFNQTRNNLNANYNFNNFVVGASNRFAYQMALRIADQPGSVVNPFYIFGSVGLGKTHLMQAIGNYILDNDINTKVLYIKASEFMEDYSKLCSNQIQQQDFDEKYRNLDVLLIDDIQILEIAKKSQMEFFKIFDILFNSNKQIVITSDRPAKELNIMERLTSRFVEGLTADIQMPNLEHRMDILKMKFAQLGYEHVDSDILEYIGYNFENNIREMEGAVNRVVYYCETWNYNIDLDTTKEALVPLISKENRNRKASRDYYTEIIGTVADYYSIKLEDILGTKRNGDIVLARQIAMYILKEDYKLTLANIGALFGGKNHSTIISSVDKINNEMRNSQELSLAISAIRKKLNAN